MVEVLAKLKLQVPKPMFETWLKRLSEDDLAGETFTIAAPRAIAVEWLNRRQYHAITSIVSELRWRETEVAFASAEPVAESEPFDDLDERVAADAVRLVGTALNPGDREEEA